MIDTESEPGAWEREIAMRPKTQEAGGRVMGNWNPTTARAKAMDRLEDQDKALRARVAELSEGLDRLCDWCTRRDVLRDEVVRARMTLTGKEGE